MSDEPQREASPEQDPLHDVEARELLQTLIEQMGFDLDVEARDEEERILLNITGDEAEALIGKKGQTLDALQFLLGRMVNRQADRERKPVVVDSGGYRQRRSEALKDLALKLYEEVTRTGKTVAVNPMSAHDRRIIHMTLREKPGVATRSEGDGPTRRLLIVPESD